MVGTDDDTHPTPSLGPLEPRDRIPVIHRSHRRSRSTRLRRFLDQGGDQVLIGLPGRDFETHTDFSLHPPNFDSYLSS